MMVMVILKISHGCCSQSSRDVSAVYGAFSESTAQVAQLLMAHLAEHEVELLARNLSVRLSFTKVSQPISWCFQQVPSLKLT